MQEGAVMLVTAWLHPCIGDSSDCYRGSNADWHIVKFALPLDLLLEKRNPMIPSKEAGHSCCNIERLA